MPRLVDSGSRADTVARVINGLLAAGGIEAVTVRAVAAGARFSPATLHEQYQGRDRMLAVMAFHVGRARVDRMAAAAVELGVFAALPDDDDELAELGAWRSWRELGRTAPWVGDNIALVDELERDVLTSMVGHPLAPGEVEWLQVVVDGLSAAMCRRKAPMSRDRARVLLGRAVERLQAW